MSDDEQPAVVPPTPPDRSGRLAHLFVHLIGHKTCSGHAIVMADGMLSITCLTCGMTSFNPNDIAAKYCGACHVFHTDLGGQRPTEARG